MLTVAYGDIVPYSRGETLLCFATMLFGVFLYAFYMGSLSALVKSLDQSYLAYEERHEKLLEPARCRCKVLDLDSPT